MPTFLAPAFGDKWKQMLMQVEPDYLVKTSADAHLCEFIVLL